MATRTRRRGAAAVGKAATRSAKSATAASLAAQRAQAARLSRALTALAHGLPNPWDESTDYFHGFVAPLPANTALDPESLRGALGIGARYHIDLSPAGPRLAAVGAGDQTWGEDIAGGFRQLTTVMQATLRDLSLAFARGNGVVRVRVWLFGRSEDGTLVGLRSTSTET